MPDAHLSALTATGGLVLLGVAFRLLEIKQVKVADFLPALLVAPLLTELVDPTVLNRSVPCVHPNRSGP